MVRQSEDGTAPFRRGIVLLASLWLGAAPAPADAQTPGNGCGRTRSINVQSGPEDAGPSSIGLQTSLDRGEPVYAVGETLRLKISVNRRATIEVWELDAAGSLTKIAPSGGAALTAAPGTPLVLPLRGQTFVVEPPFGVNELRVIARAAPANPSRSVASADTRLGGRAARQEATLCYRVVPRPR